MSKHNKICYWCIYKRNAQILTPKYCAFSGRPISNSDSCDNFVDKDS